MLSRTSWLNIRLLVKTQIRKVATEYLRLVRFEDVVLIGGIEANDNYQKPMGLDDQLGLDLAGHVDLNVRVGGLRVITPKRYVFIDVNKISRFYNCLFIHHNIYIHFNTFTHKHMFITTGLPLDFFQNVKRGGS